MAAIARPLSPQPDQIGKSPVEAWSLERQQLDRIDAVRNESAEFQHDVSALADALDRRPPLDRVEFGQCHLVSVRSEDRVVRTRLEELRGAARGYPACRVLDEE